VRNYQARNFMKQMHAGDLGFFYHSSTKVPGIVGIVKVVREAHPDGTARQRGARTDDGAPAQRVATFRATRPQARVGHHTQARFAACAGLRVMLQHEKGTGAERRSLSPCIFATRANSF
jgi:hypothetical protein